MGRWRTEIGERLTQKYADDIGADGCGENAFPAVSVARTLMAKGYQPRGMIHPDFELKKEEHWPDLKQNPRTRK